jgi:prepilin-type N-terminal cleavage/methylation domain-containing protein
MWRSPVRSRRGAGVFQAVPEVSLPARTARAACRGWTLLELMVAVFVIGVILKFSLPQMQNTMLSFRLGSAASSVAAAIQQTRYQAIMNGCYYTIAFTTGSTTYQVQAQASSGTPPTCASTFTNVGSAVSWASGSGVSLVSSTTLEFGPSGIVGLPPSPSTNPLTPCTSCSLQLSNGNATKTITISGVGNVKITAP